MHPEEELKRKVGRKLTKKRKLQRAPTVEIPQRFQDGDDAHEDVAAPRGQQAPYMNQSVFSMIAAAGSKVDFHARFDEESSDSDGESRQQPPNASRTEREIAGEEPEKPTEDWQPGVISTAKPEKHRRKLSEHRLLRSLPKLNMRTNKEKNHMSTSGLLPSTDVTSANDHSNNTTPRDAPVMSRMLEAEAQAHLHSSTSLSDRTNDMAAIVEDNEGDASPTSLAVRLMEIFGYGKPEEVISGRVFRILMEQTVLTNARVSVLAASKRSSAGLHVHHSASHLLLRLPSKEICESVYVYLSSAAAEVSRMS